MEVIPGYKQTEVGVIPAEWECEKLEEYFSFISYGFTNPMPSVQDGVFMITAADINDGRLQLETARKTSESAYRTLLTAKSKPKKNDVLLTKDGSLNRLALVGDETICINQSVAVIRPNEKVEPQFLKLLLESARYQKRMLEDAGGSTIKHIYITIVNLMPIGLPTSRDEQRAIATALSDVDGLIGALDQLIAKKRDLKQAAMQQLLTGQTRLPGFHGDWDVKTFKELFNFGGGYSASRDQLSSEGHCYLHYGDIHGATKTFVDVRADHQDIPKLDIPLKRVASALTRLSSTISPPGFSTRANSSRATSGFGTVLTTHWATTTSKEASGKSNRSASMTARPSTLRKLLSTTRWRAFRSICSERSMPTTRLLCE